MRQEVEIGSDGEKHKGRLLKVLHLPDWSSGNPYQNLLVESLQQLGSQPVLADFPRGRFPLNRAVKQAADVQVLHLHWINDLIAPILWSKSSAARFAKLVLLAADVLLVRMRGISVVWTIHNMVAHETPDRSTELLARRVLSHVCTHVILHSDRAKQRVEDAYRVKLSGKCTIIPHGNYDGCYPFSASRRLELQRQLGVDEQSVVILFFGAIRPYKGVRRLIEAFGLTSALNLRLIVAGRPMTTQFGDEIISLAKQDRRVSVLLDFVVTEDVAALFSLADAVALPFENTLTSGSVTLAQTMGKPLLLPEEARVLGDTISDCALFFDSRAALVRTLSSLNRAQLITMGMSAKAHSDAMPWEKVAGLTDKVYRL